MKDFIWVVAGISFAILIELFIEKLKYSKKIACARPEHHSVITVSYSLPVLVLAGCFIWCIAIWFFVFAGREAFTDATYIAMQVISWFIVFFSIAFIATFKKTVLKLDKKGLHFYRYFFHAKMTTIAWTDIVQIEKRNGNSEYIKILSQPGSTVRVAKYKTTKINTLFLQGSQTDIFNMMRSWRHYYG